MASSLNNTGLSISEFISSIQSIASISHQDSEILAKHKDFDLFQAYLSYLKFQKRYSTQTLRAYGHALSILASISQNNSPHTIKPELIRLAIGKARSQGLTTYTIVHRLSVWRSYMRWLENEIKIPINPLKGIRIKKPSKKLPKSLTVDQMQQLLDSKSLSQNKKNEKAIVHRNQAILELFYSSGLRLSELIQLNINYIQTNNVKTVSWIDMNESQIHVLGKGNKRRTVPIGKKAFNALAEWLTFRTGMLKASDGNEQSLFVSTRGKRISQSSVRSLVASAGLEANLPTHLHPHMFRHSFASHLLQSSNNIRAVQELLGHKSIASTQIYTALDFQYLSKAYDAAHPRALTKTHSDKKLKLK